jgi:histidine ammonia-lyase
LTGVAYILGTLTDSEIDWLLSHGKRRIVDPGESIMRAGAATTALYLVLDGELRLTTEDGEIEEDVERGDVVGEMPLLDGGPAPANVTAKGAAVVLELAYDELTAELELDPGFAARFYRALAVVVAERYRAERFGDRSEGADAPIAHGINTYLAADRMHRLFKRALPRDEVVLTGDDLTIEQVARVAWNRTPVSVSEDATETMRAARAVVEKLAQLDEPVYGVTTNLGALKDRRLSREEQSQFQRHVLLSHATGVGPELGADVVRAVILARLNGMARGGAGVGSEVFAALLAMLNAGVHPIVPSIGSVGVSDLPPLAHLSLPLVGEGEVEFDGRRLPGRDGMAAAGIALPTLGPKDGLALVSANSVSVGYGALVVSRSRDLIATADVAAALSLEALGGHTSPLDQQVEQARRFSGQLVSARQMRALLEGSSLWTAQATMGVQDPISFRSAAQVHGAVLDAHAMVRTTLETELNSTGDNPMVLIEREAVVSDGNFHPAGLSIAFDTLAIAVAQLSSMAANRIVRLMDPHFSHLPAYLAPQPDRNVGLGVIQKTATALSSLVRQGANPASLDYIPVAGSIEDHATMAVQGVAKADRCIDAALDLFAIELIVAAQGWDLRDAARLGTGTQAVYAAIRERVPLMTSDRIVAKDIATVRALLDDGSILRVGGNAISMLLGGTVHAGADRAARHPDRPDM